MDSVIAPMCECKKTTNIALGVDGYVQCEDRSNPNAPSVTRIRRDSPVHRVGDAEMRMPRMSESMIASNVKLHRYFHKDAQLAKLEAPGNGRAERNSIRWA